MKKTILLLLSCIAISGCETRSQDDFDDQPFEEELRLSISYQQAYTNVMQGARKCWRPGLVVGSPTTYELETNLYSELGYGEIYSYSSGIVFTPNTLVRIEKSGSGSIVKVKTGPIAGKRLVRSLPLRWSQGEKSCKAN